MRSAHGLLGTVALVALVAMSCTGGGERATDEPAASTTTTVADPTVVAPGGEWTRADPATTRIDPAKLDGLEALFRDDSRCLAVIEDGRLVRDTYWNGGGVTEPQQVFSVTKSITSTLIGIAQDEGLLDIDEPASTYITEWVGTPSESVTIRQLVSNTSGRFWSLANDYDTLLRAPEKTAFAIGLTQESEPGSVWNYNNAAIQTLDAVISRSTGMSTAEFARTRLFEPTGMNTTMTLDAVGDTLAFIGAKASCLDLARFGYLLSQHGRWGDRQVVSSEWIDEAITPSSELNRAYGFLLWLNGPGLVKTPVGREVEGPIWPHASPTAFAALGLGGQTVLVLPDEGLVITRTAPTQGLVEQQEQVAGEITRVLAGK